MARYNRKLYDNLANRCARRLLWLLEWLFNFVINTFRYGIKNTSSNKLKEVKEKENLVIIANGPSILQSTEEILSYTNCDYACMNYFPIKSELFRKLKPKYMFGMDVMLFDKNYKDINKREDSHTLRYKLNEVKWNMLVFTRRDMSFELNNKRIKEIRLNTNQIDGVYSRFKGKLFDWNLAIPVTCTVAAYAILTGIRVGYKNIYVYGIDNNMHEGIQVNNKNETINKDIHFYGENERKKNKNKIVNDVAGTFLAEYRNIIGYRMLEGYAKERNVKIYNCTKNSYVDAFERKNNNYD